ncbi:NTP transferase domain-containing protein [bacterium]|nr:NTP transferase domain-containing protein [bacterium]
MELKRRPAGKTPETNWCAFILAGGRSSRMGRDKSQIVVHGRSLLQHVRLVVRRTGIRVRTIRKDAVPSCGPLGGMLTGLSKTRAAWCLFVSCDMPLISAELLAALRQKASSTKRSVFVRTAKGFGFPAALPASALPAVQQLIADGERSIQKLAMTLRAASFRLPRARHFELTNVNTAADLEDLRVRLARTGEERKRTKL